MTSTARRRATAAFVLSLVCPAAARPAQAQPSWEAPASSPPTLRYDAPAGCPAEADVRARLGAEASAGRSVALDVTAADGAFAGRARLTGGGAAPVEREVSDATCASVVDALVLVVALDRANAPPRAAPDASPPAAPPTPRAPAPRPAVDAVPARDAPPEPAWELSFGLGAAAVASSFTHVGGGFTAEAARVGAFGHPRFRPSARLVVRHVVAPDDDASQTDVGLDLCPAAFQVAGALALGACATIAQGSTNAGLTSPLVAAGGTLRARLATRPSDAGVGAFLDVGAGALLRLNAIGGGVAPAAVPASPSDPGVSMGGVSLPVATSAFQLTGLVTFGVSVR